jgi:small GTP-binding protein
MNPVTDTELSDVTTGTDTKLSRQGNGSSARANSSEEPIRAIRELAGANKLLDSQPADFLFKILIVGDSAVGKTNLLSRFTQNTFELCSKSTIGVEFATTTLRVGQKGHVIRAQLWDTAGQERYHSITSTYYRGAVGALIVFDLTRRDTFEHVANWSHDIREACATELTIVMVGNKSDQIAQRQVTSAEAIEFAKRHQCAYIETSALANKNTTRAFELIVENVYLSATGVVPATVESRNHSIELQNNNLIALDNADATLPNTVNCCTA